MFFEFNLEPPNASSVFYVCNEKSQFSTQSLNTFEKSYEKQKMHLCEHREKFILESCEIKPNLNFTTHFLVDL